MKLKILKFTVGLLTLITLCISCNDDDDDTVPFVERDRTEQQIADKDSILNYLATHYYNSNFFETGTNHKYSDIIITELPIGEDVPDGNTLLIEGIETFEASYLEVDYEYYVLKINQGVGDAPNFTDNVRTRYEWI